MKTLEEIRNILA